MKLSSIVSTTAKPQTSKEKSWSGLLQRLLQYLIGSGLGLLGGATGVALTMGGAVAIQALIGPPAIFLPGIVPFTVAATGLGLGVSWLLCRVTDRILPGMFAAADQRVLNILFVLSVFTSLVEIFLFRLDV